MFYKEKYLALSPHVYDRIFEKKKKEKIKKERKKVHAYPRFID